MKGSKIYTDFSEDIQWIQDRIFLDKKTIPASIQPLFEYYIRKRLIICPEETRLVKHDPNLGRPVPYATFWFAKALELEDQEVTRDLALGLVYSSIATTLHDDILDQENASINQLSTLESLFLEKYLYIFNKIIPKNSCFWYYPTYCFREKAYYDIWSQSPLKILNVSPFSRSFLEESSRYFKATVLPTLAAIAYYTDNEDKIQHINNFLKNFSMGWRIYDDLCDWRIDLGSKNLNNSSVIMYAKQATSGDTIIDENLIKSLFLDSNFIMNAYNAIIEFYNEAIRNISIFESCYLSQFMEEQIYFHECRKEMILDSGSEFYKKLQNILD
jgi:hypothetical protein